MGFVFSMWLVMHFNVIWGGSKSQFSNILCFEFEKSALWSHSMMTRCVDYPTQCFCFIAIPIFNPIDRYTQIRVVF